jgi:uncharacterized secreted protein with C-terminal beta-propeller domain
MNLNVIGSLGRIEQGNQLTASRFVGDELFLATTPVQLSAAPGSLHVINLSDPTNPSVAGQVQMAGQVGYLQMLDATHLLVQVSRFSGRISSGVAADFATGLIVVQLGSPLYLLRRSCLMRLG